MKTALITGITGQDGAYLSKLLLAKKYRVIGLVKPKASVKNLEYLGIAGRVKFRVCDLENYTEVLSAVKKYRPDEIYNLAAISSVALSFRRPGATLKFNIGSLINLLDAVKASGGKIKLYHASSSEMFGKAAVLPVTELTPLNPISPYGVSKAAGHLIVNSYRQAYGLFAISGILFNHESFLRSPDFFVKKVIRQAIAMSRGSAGRLEVGNLGVKRDFGFSPEYVKAMWLMLQQPRPKDYVICSGKSIRLSSIVEYVFKKLGIPKSRLSVKKELYRPTELADIYGDCRKAKKELGWNYNMDFYRVLDLLIAEELRGGARAAKSKA